MAILYFALCHALVTQPNGVLDLLDLIDQQMCCEPKGCVRTFLSKTSYDMLTRQQLEDEVELCKHEDESRTHGPPGLSPA